MTPYAQASFEAEFVDVIDIRGLNFSLMMGFPR